MLLESPNISLTLHYMGYFVHFVTSCITQTQKHFWCIFGVRATKGTHVTKLRWKFDTLEGSWWSYGASKLVGLKQADNLFWLEMQLN